VGLLPFWCVAGVLRSEWDSRRGRDCLIPLDEVPVRREGEEAADAVAELSQSAGGHGLVVSNGARRDHLDERPRPRTRDEAAPRRACACPRWDDNRDSMTYVSAGDGFEDYQFRCSVVYATVRGRRGAGARLVRGANPSRVASTRRVLRLRSSGPPLKSSR
jgi:hypothetical protein